MMKTLVWYIIEDDGCGAACLHWFLTEERALAYENSLDDEYTFADLCCGSVETFIDSDIHKEAIEENE